MSPAGLAAMRIAATLAHVLPTVHLRVRGGTATLVEVGHWRPGTGGVVSPCAFRRAIAGAHEESKRGVQLRFAGLAPEEDPAIDIGLRAGDVALAGGMYRVTVGDQTIHGFATTLPLGHCRDVLEALPDVEQVVRLHHDAATEVTFVHTVGPTRGASPDAAHLAPALAALFVDEVIRELVGTG